MSSSQASFGWLTSALDDAAVELLDEVLEAKIRPQLVVCGSAVNRRTERIEELCKSAGVPCERMVAPSKVVPDPTIARVLKAINDHELRNQLKQESTRRAHDELLSHQLMAHNCKTVVLAGYMRIVSSVLRLRGHTVLNLHPAPPLGPVGRWQDVMWALIAVRANRAGAMIHVATDQMDRGPVVSYCTVPLDGGEMDFLWREFSKKVEHTTVEEIARAEGEDEPLFRAIRERQFIREAPLLIATLTRLCNGAIQVPSGSNDSETSYGVCLNSEIEAILSAKEPKQQ